MESNVSDKGREAMIDADVYDLALFLVATVLEGRLRSYPGLNAEHHTYYGY